MSEVRGLLALEAWSKKLTKGYKDVNIQNLTTSWRDGLAFCALIHHFRPDLIDFSSLSKENIHYNNNLAFTIAERELGIPSLLDPEDMVEHIEPDRRSIATYLAQFYDKFEETKTKPSHYSDCERIDYGLSSSNNFGYVPKASPRKKHLCNVCDKVIRLSEKVVINGKGYHQVCYSESQQNSNLNSNTVFNTLNENKDLNEEKQMFQSVDLTNFFDKNNIKDDTTENNAIEHDAIENNDNKNNDSKADNTKSNLIKNDNPKNKKASSQFNQTIQFDDNMNQPNFLSNFVASKNQKLILNNNESNLTKIWTKGKKLELTREAKETVGEIEKEYFNRSQTIVIPREKSQDHSNKSTSLNILDQNLEKLSLSYPRPSSFANTSIKSNLFSNEEYPSDLNPFGDTDLETEENVEDYPTELNPFEDEDILESSEMKTANLETSTYSNYSVNKDYDNSLNPFEAENNDDNEKESAKRFTPVPALRRSLLNTSPISSRSSYSTSSLERIKNKSNFQPNSDIDITSHHSTSNLSFNSSISVHTPSPRRNRKKGMAPKPPKSYSSNSLLSANTNDTISLNSDIASCSPASLGKLDDTISTISTPIKSTSPESDGTQDKSTFGYWRKKKRQAPSIPIAMRNILTISLPEIKEECQANSKKLALHELRSKQLESIITTKDLSKNKLKKSINEFLQIAKEKCALIKRQKELEYMKSQHELEEKQVDIEYQIRILDGKQVSLKTKEDEEKSKQLIQAYVDIIEKRNDIEEDIIKINTRPIFENLVSYLKQLNEDKLIELTISEFMRKNFFESRVKKDRNRKEEKNDLRNKLSKMTLKKITKSLS